MKPLIDFVLFRPVWTRRGIAMVWYAYLAATVLHLVQLVGFNLWGGLALMLVQLNLLATSILFDLANLALVRMFLEIASKYLDQASDRRAVPDAAGDPAQSGTR